MRERSDDPGDKAYHQGQRNPEVWVLRCPCVPHYALICRLQQGRWFEVAAEEQRWSSGIGDPTGQWTHFVRGISPQLTEGPVSACWTVSDNLIDRENRLVSRCDGIGRSGRTTCVLLSRPGSQGSYFLSHLSSLQGKNQYMVQFGYEEHSNYWSPCRSSLSKSNDIMNAGLDSTKEHRAFCIEVTRYQKE